MADKTYIVKITAQAEEQLQEIIKYITSELKAPKAALCLLDTIEPSISSLSQFPQRVTLTEEEPFRAIYKADNLNHCCLRNYPWIKLYAKRRLPNPTRLFSYAILSTSISLLIFMPLVARDGRTFMVIVEAAQSCPIPLLAPAIPHHPALKR